MEAIIVIRIMTIHDYDMVYSLWLSCSGMGLNNIDDSREGIERFLNRNPETCFVAENNDGEIIGSVLCGNDGRRGYIYHTAVSPRYQQQGIGRELVSNVMSALCKLKISKAALVVFNNNQNGNEFWEKIGFTQRNDLVYRNKSIVELERIDT